MRRWTTQFLVLEGGLEEDKPEPGVEDVEEVEELEGERERDVYCPGRLTCFLTQTDVDTASRQPAGAAAAELQACNSKHVLTVVPDICSGRFASQTAAQIFIPPALKITDRGV